MKTAEILSPLDAARVTSSEGAGREPTTPGGEFDTLLAEAVDQGGRVDPALEPKGSGRARASGEKPAVSFPAEPQRAANSPTRLSGIALAQPRSSVSIHGSAARAAPVQGAFGALAAPSATQLMSATSTVAASAPEGEARTAALESSEPAVAPEDEVSLLRDPAQLEAALSNVADVVARIVAPLAPPAPTPFEAGAKAEASTRVAAPSAPALSSPVEAPPELAPAPTFTLEALTNPAPLGGAPQAQEPNEAAASAGPNSRGQGVPGSAGERLPAGPVPSAAQAAQPASSPLPVRPKSVSDAAGRQGETGSRGMPNGRAFSAGEPLPAEPRVGEGPLAAPPTFAAPGSAMATEPGPSPRAPSPGKRLAAPAAEQGALASYPAAPARPLPGGPALPGGAVGGGAALSAASRGTAAPLLAGSPAPAGFDPLLGAFTPSAGPLPELVAAPLRTTVSLSSAPLTASTAAPVPTQAATTAPGPGAREPAALAAALPDASGLVPTPAPLETGARRAAPAPQAPLSGLVPQAALGGFTAGTVGSPSSVGSPGAATPTAPSAPSAAPLAASAPAAATPDVRASGTPLRAPAEGGRAPNVQVRFQAAAAPAPGTGSGDAAISSPGARAPGRADVAIPRAAGGAQPPTLAEPTRAPTQVVASVAPSVAPSPGLPASSLLAAPSTAAAPAPERASTVPGTRPAPTATPAPASTPTLTRSETVPTSARGAAAPTASAPTLSAPTAAMLGAASGSLQRESAGTGTAPSTEAAASASQSPQASAELRPAVPPANAATVATTSPSAVRAELLSPQAQAEPTRERGGREAGSKSVSDPIGRIHGFTRGALGHAMSAYGGRGHEGTEHDSSPRGRRSDERDEFEGSYESRGEGFGATFEQVAPNHAAAAPREAFAPTSAPAPTPVLAPSPVVELPDFEFAAQAPAQTEGASIALHHPDLGPIQLEVHRDRGRVEVHAVIESAHAEAVLRANESGIRQGVQQSGLNFSALRVRMRGEEPETPKNAPTRRRRPVQKES